MRRGHLSAFWEQSWFSEKANGVIGNKRRIGYNWMLCITWTSILKLLSFLVFDICPKMMSVLRVTGKSVTGLSSGSGVPDNPELSSWWTIFTPGSHHHKHALCKYKLISGDWDIHHHEKWEVRPTSHYQMYYGPFSSRKMFSLPHTNKIDFEDCFHPFHQDIS